MPDNTLYWMRANVPSVDIEDIRAMAIERNPVHQPHMDTAHKLLDSIMICQPAVGGGVVHSANQPDDLSWWTQSQNPSPDVQRALRGSMAVVTPEGAQALDAGPRFEWMQMFNWMKQ